MDSDVISFADAQSPEKLFEISETTRETAKYTKMILEIPTTQVKNPKPVMYVFNYYVDGNLMETVCHQDGTEETRVVRCKVDVAE